jgi:hypothetical protein
MWSGTSLLNPYAAKIHHQYRIQLVIVKVNFFTTRRKSSALTVDGVFQSL